MASDLKIEIFAYDIFSKLFKNFGITRPTIFQIYGDECCKSNSYVEEGNMMYYEAVLCQFLSFNTIYSKELPSEKIKNLKSLTDCYDFVIETCNRNDLFGHLTVFERIFSTSAFVLTLCVCIYFDTTSVIDVLKYGHLFWTMHFDKFTEKFYKEGGWKELKRVADNYFMMSCSFDISAESENYLNMMKEASVNYQQFKKTAQCYESENITKQWIKFRINNFVNYTSVPLSYQFSINAYEAELLLEDLKRLCNPHAENSIEVFENCPTFDSFEDIKAISDNNLQIEHLLCEQKSRITGTYCGELSENSTGFENQIQDECSISNLKVISCNTDCDTSLKCCKNTFLETGLRNTNSISFAAHSQNNRIPFTVRTSKRQFGTYIGNFPKFVDSHLYQSSENISPDIRNGLFSTKHVSSTSLGRQNDITSQVVPSHKGENAPPKSVLSPTCLNLVNNCTNITDERTHNNEDMDDIAKIMETSSVDQMGASERSENTPPKHGFPTKCYIPVNKNANTMYDQKSTQKHIEDLRNHYDAIEIRDLQRLILVLGDKQGNEYVLSTLHNSKSRHENLQENSTKRKRKSKKKKNV